MVALPVITSRPSVATQIQTDITLDLEILINYNVPATALYATRNLAQRNRIGSENLFSGLKVHPGIATGVCGRRWSGN